ncbi:MAG: methionyl-tRNA formyltransferase [Clostridiales bacterium]|nr:methionyl-tRNA formyltransferase [Clostridiales bacterium]
MKIIFMGTPDFAVPSLKALIKEHDVVSVFTQPDRPKGRGKKVAFSPVKEVAIENSIQVFQPVKLKDDKEMIKKIKESEPDFIVVVAFGQILTKEVLDIPRYGCINLHGSILPMYRGAAPINWAIIKGEKVSGNTTMLMDEGLDTGDILLKDEVNIDEDMTAGELYDILKDRGSKLLLDTLDKFSKNEIKRTKQGSETFYAKMLDKNIALINWNNPVDEIFNLIRGLNPWPIAYTNYNGEKMKIYKSKVLERDSENTPGKIIEVSKEGIKVACLKGTLLIEEIQFPNGRPLRVGEYINGHEIKINEVLS